MIRGRLRSRRAGMTLTEVMVASSITVMVIFAGLAIYLAGMASWARGESSIAAETQSRLAVKLIVDQIRESKDLVPDSDGMGLTFYLPRRDSDGNYEVMTDPSITDGIPRRIFFRKGEIILEVQGNERILARDVVTIDPIDGEPYQLFTYDIFANPRQVNITVVTQRGSGNGREHNGRVRETVFLRNKPDLSR